MSKIKINTHTGAEQRATSLTLKYNTTQSDTAVCMAKVLKRALHKAFEVEMSRAM